METWSSGKTIGSQPIIMSSILIVSILLTVAKFLATVIFSLKTEVTIMNKRQYLKGHKIKYIEYTTPLGAKYMFYVDARWRKIEKMLIKQGDLKYTYEISKLSKREIDKMIQESVLREEAEEHGENIS